MHPMKTLLVALSLATSLSLTVARAAPDAVTAGSLTLSGGVAKAMPPGARVGGGGLVIANSGSADDRLVSVESPAAGRVELHEMTMENDVMRMRKLDGVPLPAGQTVTLTGGGLHLMFMDVKAPFRQGDSIGVTLNFEKAGAVAYSLPVGSVSGN